MNKIWRKYLATISKSREENGVKVEELRVVRARIFNSQGLMFNYRRDDDLLIETGRENSVGELLIRN